nr:PREDICTED: protein FAM53B isoform X1 [Lepisosteus oculatus]
MCITMVIIHPKTLEKKKGVDDVTCKASDSELQKPQKMSKGTALYACGVVESDGWRDLGRGCAFQKDPGGASLECLWGVLPGPYQGSRGWVKEAGAASAITNLIRDLSLSDAKGSPSAAPPSKRQCRSLSFSDELSVCRPAWRPQGSRVWTAVEKRRCHSGGSVQRGPCTLPGYPAMQRSSSFSLPARSNAFPQHTACLPIAGFQPSPPSSSSSSTSEATGDSAAGPRPLSLSHEQICLPEPRGPSADSSPDSTPELGRRAGPGGLSRSRSQPCVLNEKKIGVKRRRPEEAPEQRPSLDLAKMTQKLQNFHSLSCPGFTGADCSQSSQAPPSCKSISQYNVDSTPDGDMEAETHQNTEEEGGESREDLSNEELVCDFAGCGDSKKAAANGEQTDGSLQVFWGTTKNVFQLDGELDIEQIERN